jgi:crotonobetaine/carnitine-CoA ligase
MVDLTEFSSDRAGDLRTLVDRAAARWGGRPALTFDRTGRVLTFEDVAKQSNLLANGFRALGVKPGDRVAVMLRNQPEFPLAWLALGRIGATMVPVNVFYTEPEARYLLEHSGARLALTSAEFVPLLGRLKSATDLTQVVDADPDPAPEALSLAEVLQGAGDGASRLALYPETLANVQYTSGTTGRPKGCMLSHGYWLRIAEKLVDVFPRLREDDVMLTAQPFYYMDPQWNVAGALLAGAHLVILDRFHPSTFWSTARRHRVTFFYCLGMMPTALLKMPPDSEDRSSRVRAITCSAIPPGLHEQLEERWGVPWYEVFGMTETGGDLMVTDEDHDRLLGTGCIGRPYGDRDIRVVGDDDRPLERGRIGEMVLRGRGLMDGYFRNPEATAEAFRNGWFHTGDLVRMDEEGLVYYVGRSKEVIRRSGENISATEVEEAIRAHPAVALAACVAVPDELRGEEIKAYVVLQSGESAERVTPQLLADFCAGRLAYFKVPRYWTYRRELPLTPSERVVKSLLTAGESDRPAGSFDRVEGRWR